MRAAARGAPSLPVFAFLAISLLRAYCAGPAAAEVELPTPSAAQPIVVTAQRGIWWNEGAHEVWVLEGNLRLVQGPSSARSRAAVLWIDRAKPREHRHSRAVAYLEDNVALELDDQGTRTRLTDQAWLGRFQTAGAVDVHVLEVLEPPAVEPAIHRRAVARRARATAGMPSRGPITDAQATRATRADAAVRPAQYTGPYPAAPPAGPTLAQPMPAGPVRAGSPLAEPPFAGPTLAEPIPAGPILPEPIPTGTATAAARRITVLPRSDVPVQVRWQQRDPASDQWIAVIDQGVNVIVEGVTGVELGPVDVSAIDVTTDRMVIWTINLLELDENQQAVQPEDVPLEIYMEGNIVFREEERVIYADRMYYDVAARIGIVLNAEMLAPVPDYEGLLRLKTDVLQQIGKNRFTAQNTFITSSRMGRPGYRIQTANATLQDDKWPVVDPWTGLFVVDPETDQPLVEHQRLATGRNNWLYLGEVPIFYWPFLATDLTDPSFYIRRARLKNDSVFGTQILTNWDGYQLFGIRNRPAGTDWDISLDYLSKRGFGHGTTFTYGREDFMSLPGPTSGLFDFWGVQDHGTDNLGRLRRDIPPDQDYRYRLFWQHRHLLPYDLQLSAEVGWISDRNFLEQYYEREWDELKDQTTGVELKQIRDNVSWSVTADYGLNKFFTHTDSVPRADHFWLGQPLFGDVFTWYEHTQVGYGRFNTAVTPDPLLPWETTPTGAPLDARGERFATRHEIDWPLQMGPVKVVPYALGEFAHWGEDRAGDEVQRAYGQLGIRASLPMWKVNPTRQSDLWNVHGLAHKVVFDADLSYSDANRDLGDLPLYDPLDDNSIEAFRRRATDYTFGGSVRPQFDERYYALRSGLAGWVTSPSTEIADDLLALRLGARQRWQTKRGMPGRRRIVDWAVLDTHLVLFPEKDRDNFGQLLGLVDYDFRWHLGDRLTLLSDGIFDFFEDGQHLVTVGGVLSRPPRGSLYAGIHLLEGPFSSEVFSCSYSYRMSEKWVSSFGMSVDFGGDGNIGQNFSVTRIGESLLVSAGLNVDASRDSVGAHLSVEPRFLPKSRLGRAGGARIPVAGALGLE